MHHGRCTTGTGACTFAVAVHLHVHTRVAHGCCATTAIGRGESFRTENTDKVETVCLYNDQTERRACPSVDVFSAILPLLLDGPFTPLLQDLEPAFGSIMLAGGPPGPPYKSEFTEFELPILSPVQEEAKGNLSQVLVCPDSRYLKEGYPHYDLYIPGSDSYVMEFLIVRLALCRCCCCRVCVCVCVCVFVCIYAYLCIFVTRDSMSVYSPCSWRRTPSRGLAPSLFLSPPLCGATASSLWNTTGPVPCIKSWRCDFPFHTRGVFGAVDPCADSPVCAPVCWRVSGFAGVPNGVHRGADDELVGVCVAVERVRHWLLCVCDGV